MNNGLKVWVIERDNALETRDVNKLIEFMEKWTEKGLYDKKIYEQFKNATPQVQLGTMCKMIMSCIRVSKETKEWAKNELDKMGWSYEF